MRGPATTVHPVPRRERDRDVKPGHGGVSGLGEGSSCASYPAAGTWLWVLHDQPVFISPGGCVLCTVEVGSLDPAQGPMLVPHSQDRDPSVEAGVRLWGNFCRGEQRVSIPQDREGCLPRGELMP